MYRLFPLILLLLGQTALPAQLWTGRDTLYGNEWIDYDQVYYKIPVVEDGMHRLSYDALRDAGLPVDVAPARRYRIFHLGREVPLFTSAGSETPMRGGDYLEFFGVKNRTEMDRHLFQNPDEEMLNPHYSMFTDTAVYFLTIAEEEDSGQRYRDLANDPDGPFPRETWYWDTLMLHFAESHYNKKYAQDLVTYAAFDEGEGFASDLQSLHTLRLNPRHFAPASGQGAQLRLRLYAERGEHHLQISLNGRVLVSDSTIAPYSLQLFEFDVPPEELQAPLDLRIEGLRGNRDQYAVGSCLLRYPARFAFPDREFLRFMLDPQNSGRLIQLEDLPDTITTLTLYDPTHAIRMQVDAENSSATVAWPAASRLSRIVADLRASAVEAADLKEVRFRDFRREDAQYLIISHPRLMKGPANPVQAYAEYRGSASGGGFRTVTADVEQLYDQFGYGIRQHPQALRNFGFYAKKHWTGLRYILLLGHALDYHLIRASGDPRRAQNLAPSFGSPGSDNLLFAPNNSSVPLAAVGRVAASVPADIDNYLDKVKIHEAGLDGERSFANQAWRKRVLHLVGGKDEEKDAFRRRLDQAAAALESNNYAAAVTTVSRRSNDPVQQSLSQEVINALDEGVGIKAFLGHGGVTTTDFGLDDPFLFDNTGRYPLIFSLGCLSGYTSDFQNSLSEQFVLTPKRGGIAYIASAGFATATPLTILTRTFYELIGGDLYGRSAGEVLNEVRHRYDGSTDLFYRSLLQEFFYHGDPALRINGPRAPDYVVDFSSVTLSPSIAGTNTDSMEVRFTLANTGAVRNDSLVILLQHITPDGAEFTYRDTLQLRSAFRELRRRFPLHGPAGRGINRLRITLDPDDLIAEEPAPAAEQNNSLSGPDGQRELTFFVTDRSVEPVYPPPFSIVGEEAPILHAAPADLFARDIGYVLEVDTTSNFNGPSLYRRRIPHDGGLLSHQPAIDWQADQAYYWRLSPDSLSSPETGWQWNGASFLYRPGSRRGWNQSHYFQYAANTFEGLQLRETERSLQYEEVLTGVTAFAEIFSLEENNVTSRIFLDNIRVVRNWPPPSLGILVLDPRTGAVEEQGVYRLDEDERRREAVALLQSVPKGRYVTLVTFRGKEESYLLERWASDSAAVGATLYGLLEAEGATRIRELAASGEAPYAVAYRKGKGLIRERLGAPGELSASVYFEIPSLLDRGSMTSTLIGPARDWGEMEWSASAKEAGDSLSLQIYGLSAPGAEPVLLEQGDTEKRQLDFVDPQNFPFLQLVLATSDTLQRSAPQPDYWRVYHEPAGDLVLDPVAFTRDTLQQGEVLQVIYRVHHFGAGTTDSVELQISIRDAQNKRLVFVEKLSPVPAFGAVTDTFRLDTRELNAGGEYQLVVEADPGAQIPERSTLNNTGLRPFYLRVDEEQPLLDVTFDGRHIMNGDLVSVRPFIVISLQDENPFLPLRDTSALSILLRYPDETRRPIYFQEESLRFFPAEPGEANRARVEWEPVLEQNGTYTMEVQGRDVRGNAAGAYAYTVSFEVDNRQRISNVLPYPNPFSTATRFSYTMTGAEEPAFFLIQIMTVSGRVVREITKEEFGPLRVGSHLSDFVWDGTDQFGDRLANGVYLYRVIVKDEQGADYERYEQPTDRFFKKNMGKIVILR